MCGSCAERWRKDLKVQVPIAQLGIKEDIWNQKEPG
jgi:hypothetical protein